MKLLTAIVALTAVALSRPTAATHLLIGEPPRLGELENPSVYVYEMDVNGNRMDLVLPCTIMDPSMVSYSWYRDNQPFTPDIVDMNGTLTIFNITEGESASTGGVEYFCVASKAIGKNTYTASIRSKTITVFYAAFGGFQQMDVGEVNISVGLGSDIALECDVLPSSPPPVIQWLEGDVNGENFSPVTDTPNTNLIRFLEGGRYLFYSFPLVDESRLMSTYRCQVTNALLDRTRLAPTTYRLVSDLVEGVLTDFKTIGDLTGFVGDTDFEFSYVGGFHTGVMDGVNSTDITYLINGSDIATNSMGVELRNIARLNRLNMIGRFYLTAEVRRGGVVESKTGTLTVRQRPAIVDSPDDDREIVLGEENKMYTCEFEGNPSPTISWYFNGRPISADSGVSTVGNTLSIASPQVSNSGIYQCFVNSEYGEAQASWLLEIRPSIQPVVEPFNFTALDAFNDREPIGLLIVRENGSVANFYVDLVADPCPTVQWSFNGTMLGPTNDTFSYNDPCAEPGATSPNWRFTLDVALSENTSGSFSAVFTNIAGSVNLPPAYFTIPSESVTLERLDLVNQPCLVEGRNVSMRCYINGFPRPTLQFMVGGALISPGEGIYENHIVQEFYDEITILNVNMSAGMEYRCTATSGDIQPIERRFDFCTLPVISTFDATPNPEVGGDFKLSCTASGTPLPEIMWTLDGRVLQDTDMLRIVFTTPEERQRTSNIEVSSATENFNGEYKCIATNTAGNDSHTFEITLEPNSELPISVPAIIGIAAGGVALILLIALVVLLLVCVYTCALKSTKGNYSANPAYLGSDYADGRGNVDKDSDEEDGQPEAFNPQYESLPALRPSQPPSYKPTPSYPMGDDMEMRKVPLPDSDSYLGGGGYLMQDNGTSPYNRPVVDDFLSEDAQFV